MSMQDPPAPAALDGGPLTLAEIARLVGGKGKGPEDLLLKGIASLEEAGPEDVAFFSGSVRTRERVRGAPDPGLLKTRAGLLLLPEGMDAGDRPCVHVEKPGLAAVLVARHFHPGLPRRPAGIDPGASVHPTAHLGRGVFVGPGCEIRAGARIGDGCQLAGRVFLGENAEIGPDCHLFPGVVIHHEVRIGRGCVIQANTVIGSEGFGYIWDGSRHLKMPQMGTVEIGDGVEIGACVCIDRGTFGATTIGEGCIIDNLVQIGHNCEIGRWVVLCGQVGLSGSTRVEDGAQLGGQAGSAGHITVGKGAQVSAQAGMSRDVPAGSMVMGSPAWDYSIQVRAFAIMRRMALQELKKHGKGKGKA